MQLAELITPDRIECDVEAQSKKRALERLSELISYGQDKVTALDAFNSMIARERKGSTGFGQGVAIPHGRLKTTRQALGAFIKLRSGVDFDAVDKQPVDLLFALLVPDASDKEHLQLLAQLAQMMRDEQMREKLRQATDTQSLYQLIVNWSQQR